MRALKTDEETNTFSNLQIGHVGRKHFKYITEIERNRFERELNISSDTKSIVNEVSAKTENKYLQLIQLFAGALLKNGLSEKPFTDAEQLERKLAACGTQLPCTKETLAKYLKANRF